MFKKTRNIALMGAALAALSFGGSALATAGAAPVSPAKQPAAKAAVVNAGQPDAETNDGVQQSGAKDAETNDGVQQSGATQGSGTNDAETADGPENGADTETADGQESGSEVAGNDGPGGHADEPGNPNAEHEASGQE
jgi:hypothetical protein